jgi:hypothetical protein
MTISKNLHIFASNLADSCLIYLLYQKICIAAVPVRETWKSPEASRAATACRRAARLSTPARAANEVLMLAAQPDDTM